MNVYKRSVSIALTIVAVVSFGLMTSKNADSKIVTNVEADISGDALKAVVVEDFEKGSIAKSIVDDGWFVKSTPKKYANESIEKKMKRKNPVPVLDLKFLGGAPNDMQVEEWSLTDLGKAKTKILGVRFKFRYPGHNSIHILPPKEVDWKSKKPVLRYNPSTRKDEQERGIQLPGKSKALSIWVHGRGNPYRMEIWVKDYRGDTHILKIGSVNFVGWRPMKVSIPGRVPQSYESYPQTRVTKIVRFVLRSEIQRHAEELTENTYFFFDQLKVLTDTYEVNFDGSSLHDSFDKGSSGGTKPQP